MQDDKSRIDQLNDSLYSRTRYKAPDDHREALDVPESDPVEKDWRSPELDELLSHERRQTPNFPIMKKLFTFALVFCVAAAAVAGYIYIGGGNLISSKNVEISVEGPVSVTAGEPLELAVTIINKNNADLTLVNMIIEYPEGTREIDDSTKPLIRTKENLGAIPAGKSLTRTTGALLFGQKGEIKNIRVSLDYKVKGSNATFSKEKIYDISLGNAPVSMTIEKPETVSSGDTFTTTITVIANSNEAVKDVLVRAEYPYGYAVTSSEPKAVQNNNIWNLGDMAPGDKKTITLSGALTGENAEERTFRFYVGAGKGNDPKDFDPLVSALETIGINRSPLALTLRLNGENKTSHVAPSGGVVQGTVVYKNNLPSNVRDGRIEVVLGGTALDRFSVNVQNGGFYNSGSNSIIWDKSNVSNLDTLAPGDEGSLSFTFASLSNLAPGTRNSEISLKTIFTARGGSPDGLVTKTSSTLKIASEVTFSGRTLYSRGPFKNTGPIPPKAEKQTTYTAVLDLGNTSNEVINAKVTAVLGPNVKWLGASPANESVTYDENSRTVTWSPGTLASGAGFSAPGKEISLNVALTPSIGQIGSAPVLLQNVTFKGTDSFTSQNININLASLTTNISSDPKYVQGDELVVK